MIFEKGRHTEKVFQLSLVQMEGHHDLEISVPKFESLGALSGSPKIARRVYTFSKIDLEVGSNCRRLIQFA